MTAAPHVTLSFQASLALEHAYKELMPMFEKDTGIKIDASWPSSVEMMARLKAGEVTDVVGLSAQAIDAMIEAGALAAGSRADVASSCVGVAVKKGAPRPDTSSWAALKAAVLAAPTVGISSGPSGIYLKALFEKEGMMPAIASKLSIIGGSPVGAQVADGRLALGFQQMIELQPVPGLDFWPISDDVQKVTMFSLGIHAKAPHAAAAQQWVAFCTSAPAAKVLEKHGADAVAK
jgi:molybdate transport system substrate-binding protein